MKASDSGVFPSSSAVKAALALGALGLGLAACADRREEFPSGVELGEELAASASGLMDSCVSAEYRLSDSTAEAIDARGLGFFSDLDTASAYGPWTETPLAPEQRRPWGAFGGCGDARDRARADQLDQVLRSSGSYYAFTQDHQGMLLIVPGMKLAAIFFVR